jgi:hypothetical protein
MIPPHTAEQPAGRVDAVLRECPGCDWLQNTHSWAGLKAIGKVERVRKTAAKTTTEMAYYLLSTPLSAERLNEVVRSHWGVENQHHWRLDVVMNEDQDRTRLGNLRHMAINAMQKEGSKAPCEASSSEPAETTPISRVYWRSSEVRLPWADPCPLLPGILRMITWRNPRSGLRRSPRSLHTYDYSIPT